MRCYCSTITRGNNNVVGTSQVFSLSRLLLILRNSNFKTVSIRSFLLDIASNIYFMSNGSLVDYNASCIRGSRGSIPSVHLWILQMCVTILSAVYAYFYHSLGDIEGKHREESCSRFR